MTNGCEQNKTLEKHWMNNQLVPSRFDCGSNVIDVGIYFVMILANLTDLRCYVVDECCGTLISMIERGSSSFSQ